tara:strand:- start:913 stop:2739 length:1827 start_codon:yes stop_codon:yes gene_type:complete
MDIKEKVKNLTTNPGVYFFKDNIGKILYIGKAKNLKKRVSSYFNKSSKNSKNKIMISKAVDVDSMIAENEVEALLIEANMIKLYKPKYNVFMKDDKSFPYIIISNEPYPRVEIIRKKNLHKDNNIYFGPYTDVHYLRSIIKIIHQIFPIRTCDNYIDKKLNNKKIIKKGTCFCGFCLSEEVVTEKQYSEIIKKVIQFLKGKNKNVKIFLNKLMNQASIKMRYEEAARIRDQINALNIFEKKQTKITQKFVNRDIINIEYKSIYGLALILRVRNGLLIGREKFNLKIFNEFDISDELDRFLVQYYQLTMDIPSEILIKNNIESKSNIEEWLSDKTSAKVKIFIPNRGDKKQMLDLCIKNNQMLLKEYLIKKIKRKDFLPKTLIDLKNDLNMSIIPKRIEAFDNSNIQGSSAVAGMVCFIDGKPVKSKYRHYNIKTVEGIDDFESMREVVYRRYLNQLNENKPLPDLILIDGGKGQLSAAKSSLDKLNLSYISIIGLAKKLEEIYLPGLSNPQNIGKTSSSLYLLRKIRDEVHRFSINFHRIKRDKSTFNSILNDIKGLGGKRIRLIWENYNSLYELNNDSINNIYNKTKIPISIIKKIRNKINIRNENE